MGGGNVARASILVDADVSGAAKAINKLRSELTALERAKFAPGTKAATAATKEVDKLNKSIHALGGTVDKSGNFINRHSAAINQLAFSAARAGSGFANFLPLIARVTTLLSKHEFGEGAGIGKGLSSLKEKFSGASAAAKGLEGATGGAASAIAGISFSAIAAAAAVAALVAVIGFLTVKLGPLGSALTRAQEGIKNIFGDASADVESFAERASTAFGITEQAALSFLGKTGQLFQSFGIGVSRSAQLSKSLLVVADVLRTTSQTFIDAETTMQATFDVAAGNIEGLRQFGIFLTEVSIKETALAHGINVTTGTLDNQQRSLAALLAVNDEAIRRFEQYTKTQDSAARVSERTAAAFADIKAKLGQGFAPLLAFVANAFLGVLISIKGIVESAQDFFDRHPLIVKALKAIAAVAIKAAPGLEALIKVMGFFGKKGKEAAEEALSLEERMAALLDAGKALEDQLAKTFEPTIEQLKQLRDAHVALQRAIEDAARAEADALLRLQRTREDAVRKTEDALRDLAETEETAQEKIFDARRKRHDVQIKNFRAIRDAEEKLKEARVEGAKKVEEAERDLFKARIDRFEKLVGAQISLEEALFRGDVFAERSARLALLEAQKTEGIAEARRKLGEAQEESAKKIAEALRDLDEERFDAHRRLVDANRDLQRTIEEQAEAIEAARRKVHETEIEINRALFDANKNLLDTQRESAEAIGDAKQNLDDLNVELGTTNLTFAEILDKIERLQNGLGVAVELMKEINLLRDPGNANQPGVVNPDGSVPLFAHGGFFQANRPRIVGEHGPELEIPGYSGQIISNERLVQALIAAIQGWDWGGPKRGSDRDWDKYGVVKGGREGPMFNIYDVSGDPSATAAAVINRMVLEGLS